MQKWRAIDNRPTADWAPAEGPTVTEPVVKRRRVRKRKRRPPPAEDELRIDGPPEPNLGGVETRPRPHRLEDWPPEDLMSEEPFRPLRGYKRRRLYPKYDESPPPPPPDPVPIAVDEDREVRKPPPVERIRDPYTALREDNRKVHFPRRKLKEPKEGAEETTVSTRPPIDLKAILKQAGGISLSELLQRKNLTLNDLLKGEQHALNALASAQSPSPTPKRQKRPLTVTTEATSTTERRIFVPSHPKYYTSVDFKPDVKDLDLKKPEAVDGNDEDNSVETSTKPPLTTRRTLPPTLAKLRNLHAKTSPRPVANDASPPAPALLPDKAIKIDINELFGFGSVVAAATTTKGPLRIPVEIRSTPIDSTSTTSTSTEFVSIEVASEETLLSEEKTRPASAKEEIAEVLADTASRESLMHILGARNMTLDELLEQRERGSSQRHLADIFHNQTKEPEPKSGILINKVVLNPPPPPIEDVVPRSTYEIRPLSFPTKRTNEIVDRLVPLWRQAYTNNPFPFVIPFPREEDTILDDEAHRVEQIENQIAEAVNGALAEHEEGVPRIGNDIDVEEPRLPHGVRSALVASATIVGVSLGVFATIFAVFKWSQRRSKRISYSDSLSSARMRSPILSAPASDHHRRHRRLLGHIVHATIGRSRKPQPPPTCAAAPDPHGYLWENDRKPFQ